jgi:hypothetical protein
MRPNVRLSADEVMLAQVRRKQQLRQIELKPAKQGPDIPLLGYLFALCVLITGILITWARH